MNRIKVVCMLSVILVVSGCGLSTGKIINDTEDYVMKGKLIAQKGADVLGDIIKNIVSVGVRIFESGKSFVEGLKDVDNVGQNGIDANNSGGNANR